MRWFVLVVALSGSAWAQCKEDAECPAGGTCSSGTCVTPSTPMVPAPVETTRPSLGDQATKQASLGWSPGGAVLGFTGTGLVVPTGIMAMFFLIYGPNSGNAGLAVAFMLASSASVVGFGLLAHFGARSAEADPSDGSHLGWLGLGFSIASLGATVACFPFFFSYDSGVAFLLQLGALVSGALGLLFFGIEAVERGASVLRMRKQAATKSAAAPVRVMPTVSFAPRADGRTVDPVLGLAGTF